MTIAAFEKGDVGRVLETGIEGLEFDISDLLVAFLAVALYGKGGFSVVASTAGLAGLHVRHGVVNPVATRSKKPVVAFTAGKGHIEVQLMAEDGLTGHGNLRRLVASDAVALDREGGLSVVAGATPLAVLHLRHAQMRIVADRPEQGIVAIATGIHPKVFGMAVLQGTKVRYFDGYVANLVAFGAVAELEPTGISLVVAGSAGFLVLHVRHGVGGILFPHDVENGVVAGGAVVFKLQKMQ